jgi:hypothetical protein
MEKIPPHTYEIQAGHILGLNNLQDMVDWAGEAIVGGYDSQSLRILAGLQAPFDDKEINRLFNKAFDELDIVSLTRQNCVPFYIVPIVRKAVEGRLTKKEALEKLKDLCLALNHEKALMKFYLLYHALSDLEISELQWYWKGATRDNINEIIDDYFQGWLKNHDESLLI